MIKVLIKNTDIEAFSGVGKVSGKPFSVRKQTGWAYIADRNGKAQDFPERIDIALQSKDGVDQPAYPVGEYTLSPLSVSKGDYDQLQIRNVILDPVRPKI